METTNRTIDRLIAYENDELNMFETIILFSELIRTGLCWKLQGHYGRTAQSLIDNNLIFKNGEVNVKRIEDVKFNE